MQRAKVVVQDPASKVIRTGAGITLNKYIDIHLDGGDQCSNFPAYSWLQVCNIALQQELEVLRIQTRNLFNSQGKSRLAQCDWLIQIFLATFLTNFKNGNKNSEKRILSNVGNG